MLDVTVAPNGVVVHLGAQEAAVEVAGLGEAAGARRFACDCNRKTEGAQMEAVEHPIAALVVRWQELVDMLEDGYLVAEVHCSGLAFRL